MHAAVAAMPAPAPSTETAVVSHTADELIKEIGIPPCPTVLTEFIAETKREEPDFRRLSHLVNKDTALAASILKTINSPFYGLGKKARTVQEALTLLGLRETTRLISGLLLRRAFASYDAPAMQEYWDRSSRVAMVSAYLARELEAAPLEEAHTFALFRDCGIPVLLIRFSDYEEMLAQTRNENERRRSDMERLRYGFDHALVGATLAQSWHLPSETWQAIRIHNGYETPDFAADERNERSARLIALGLLAERLLLTHRGVYDANVWSVEEAFVTEVLGALDERLAPLGNDIARIIEQS
ncbi:MAG: HDOD domain-containing protein [Betaproteobacteria bacterium]|nr:MAG: HDOD domain-containing protein [Betaproteobacteria bacterium]